MSARRAAAALAAAVGLLAAGCGGGDPGVGMLEKTDEVTLLQVQTEVFTPRCALSGCHTGPGAPFGLDLSSVEDSGGNLVGVASGEQPDLLRVKPFDPPGSYLYMKVTADPDITGDPMPAAGGPLDAGDLALVESWIASGAN